MPFTVEAMPFASSDVIPASAHVDSERSPKVSAGLSSSSLSTLDISLNFGASEFDTGTTRLIDDWNFETMCRRDQDSCPPRYCIYDVVFCCVDVSNVVFTKLISFETFADVDFTLRVPDILCRLRWDFPNRA